MSLARAPAREFLDALTLRIPLDAPDGDLAGRSTEIRRSLRGEEE